MLPCKISAQYEQQQKQQQQQLFGALQQAGSMLAGSSSQDISCQMFAAVPAAAAAAAAGGQCDPGFYGQVQNSQNASQHESLGAMRLPSEDSAATTVQQPHNGSGMLGFADVRAAAAVEAVAPGSTAWVAAVELIKLQGQEPTTPLVTLVAAGLLAQQRQQQDGTLDLLGSSSGQLRVGSGISSGSSAGGRMLLGGGAAAAGGGRTTAGNITRFCKRGSGFVARPAAQRGVLSGVDRPGDALAAAAARAGQQHGRNKGRTTCQVDGCMSDLPSGKDTYNGRYRVCAQHMMVSSMFACLLGGGGGGGSITHHAAATRCERGHAMIAPDAGVTARQQHTNSWQFAAPLAYHMLQQLKTSRRLKAEHSGPPNAFNP
jgi:hypothetical protein